MEEKNIEKPQVDERGWNATEEIIELTPGDEAIFYSPSLHTIFVSCMRGNWLWFFCLLVPPLFSFTSMKASDLIF